MAALPPAARIVRTVARPRPEALEYGCWSQLAHQTRNVGNGQRGGGGSDHVPTRNNESPILYFHLFTLMRKDFLSSNLSLISS